MKTRSVKDIIDAWENEGQDSHPDDPKLPLHPELIYRIKGTWNGWNDFLNTEISSPTFEHHIEQDALENQAWSQYKKRLN